jgi:hypothetical protein
MLRRAALIIVKSKQLVIIVFITLQNQSAPSQMTIQSKQNNIRNIEGIFELVFGPGNKERV